MSLIEQIKLATIEAGMPQDLADRIAAHLEKQEGEPIAELLNIAKTEKPSVLVWSFAYWPDTKEDFRFWWDHAYDLEDRERKG